MDRRKFIAAMGSIAAGGAAAMGTGAFTSVEADRDVSVNVAGDSQALLAIRKDREGGSITPNADDYVNISGGQISLDFTDTDAPGNGNGVNDNATTEIDNLLQIENQGTQSVYVGYTAPASNGAKKLTDAGFAMYHEDSDFRGPDGGSSYNAPTTTPSGANIENDGQLNIDTAPDADDDDEPDLVYLDPGEKLEHIGAFFYGSPNPSVINSTPVTFKAADDFEDL